jgi:hypothetical protein
MVVFAAVVAVATSAAGLAIVVEVAEVTVGVLSVGSATLVVDPAASVVVPIWGLVDVAETSSAAATPLTES